MKATPILTPMIKKDLVNLANELPYTGEDHLQNILWWYEREGNLGVDIYEYYVEDSIKRAHEVNSSLVGDFISKAVSLCQKLSKSVIGLVNRLK